MGRHDVSGYDPGANPGRVAVHDVGADSSGVEPVYRHAPDWRDDSQTLWRGDSRTPTQIAEAGGFAPVDPHGPVDLKAHIGGQTNGYVSTSTSPTIALGFGAKSEGFVYRVKAPGGIHTDHTQQRAGLTAGTQWREKEVIFPGGVDFRHVEGWHKIWTDASGKRWLGEFEPNPHYLGGERANAPAHPEGLENPSPVEQPQVDLRPTHVREREEAAAAAASAQGPPTDSTPHHEDDDSTAPHTDTARRSDDSTREDAPSSGLHGDAAHDNAAHPDDAAPDRDAAHDGREDAAGDSADEPKREAVPADRFRGIQDTLSGHDAPADLARPGDPLTEPAVHAGTGSEPAWQEFLDKHFPGYGDINAHNADRPVEDGYRTNCVEALIAEERGRAGEPVQARPTRPEDVAAEGRLSRVRDALGGTWTSHHDLDGVTAAMRSTPEGARGAVAFRYTDADGHTTGHVVRVVHTEDGVAFADPQTGQLARLPADARDVRLLSEDYTDDTAHTEVEDDGGYGRAPQEQRDQPVEDTAGEHAAPIVDAHMHDDLAADPGHRVVRSGYEGRMREERG
ncbi:scabin-related ADP-ribosyltransferase [Actinokineospora bangkokensis]|uniref:Uncharacterized protein n=1 Tax=Actinokineospora bangkokensis TaxID=1193682 RepID=A0A1Q9LLN8_9PSEU|nr:toxin glutamine deamidase domain-containing protein [Actinokineospora bangkokensis]OLR92914.1 hypothetical protein BJP25_18235 [Actinokineospora bangkokensis]